EQSKVRFQVLSIGGIRNKAQNRCRAESRQSVLIEEVHGQQHGVSPVCIVRHAEWAGGPVAPDGGVKIPDCRKDTEASRAAKGITYICEREPRTSRATRTLDAEAELENAF